MDKSMPQYSGNTASKKAFEKYIEPQLKRKIENNPKKDQAAKIFVKHLHQGK